MDSGKKKKGLKLTRLLKSIFLVGVLAILGACADANRSNVSINGIVSKGPIEGATVIVYALNSDGTTGEALGTATTDADGYFAIEIGEYAGNVLVVSNGGQYIDEATTTTKDNPGLRTALANVKESNNVAVTTLTEIAARRAEGAGGFITGNIDEANTFITGIVGLDIVTTFPADVLDSSSASATEDEKEYGLILAGMSQMVADGAATSIFDAISTISGDLTDNQLDQTGNNLVTAIKTFAASPSNSTGIVNPTINIATAPVVTVDNYLFSVADPRDMAYHWQSNTLYIGSGGNLLQYDMATGNLLTTTPVGSSLLGMDISPDGSQIAVANDQVVNSEVRVKLVSTSSHAVSEVSFPQAFMETGTYSVAYTAGNDLITTSTFGGSGWVPLRHVDLGTGSILYETSVRQDTMLSANSSNTLIAYSESNISSGPYAVYEPTGQSLLSSGTTSSFLYEISIDRTNSYIAVPTYQSLRIIDMAGNVVYTEPSGTYGPPVGVAYNPAFDLLYVPWAYSSKIGVYNSTTQAFVENIQTPYTFPWNGNWGMSSGRIKISDDGALAFVKVDGGIYVFKTLAGGV